MQGKRNAKIQKQFQPSVIIYKIYSREGCFKEWTFNYTCFDQAFHFKQKQLVDLWRENIQKLSQAVEVNMFLSF